jgi:ABC-type uncharacterized transport system auxiliary subunit
MMRALFLCFLCAGFLSCGGSRAVNEQLILYFNPESLNPEQVKQPAVGYPFKVQVKDLEINRLYDNASMVVRSSDNTVRFSKKGIWAVRPNVSASDLLEEVLKNSLKFKALKDRFADSSPDYTIRGSVESVEENLRKPGERLASLAVTLQIVRTSDDQAVFEKMYTRDAAVEEDAGYGDVAKELSVSLLEIYRLFIADAVRIFNKELETSHAKNDGKDQ